MSDDKPEAATDAPSPDAPANEAHGGKPVDAAGEDAAQPAEPEAGTKKRKRRRKKVEDTPLRASLSPEGRERPAFLLGFPEDPELERVMRAFELGNYAFVRKAAPELAEKTTDPKVRAAAEELARRIEPDPLVKVLLGIAAALLVLLTVWAYKTHGG